MPRQHSSPADFELVGLDRDPTPGDPDLIRGILQRYRDIGDAAEKALNVLKRDGALAQGRGSAIDKLREKVGDDLPDKLTKTMNSYHDAAQAYTDYIPRLQEAQDTFDRAVEQAQSAAPQAGRPPRTLGPDATDQEKADARQTQDAIDQGRQQLGAAKSLAEQARSLRESAQRSCADVLDRAAGEAIPERSVFQKIADFFKDFPFVQILLGLLIAVVSVFFPVAGLLLGGALFAITQISAIASGNFSLGDFLTGLIGLVPGGSLIKAAGGALVKGGAAAIEKLAPGLAKAVGGSIKGLKGTIGASKTIGPLVKSDGARLVGDAAKEFGKEAGDEAATEVLNGDQLDAGAILGAGALGVAGGGFAGGRAKNGRSGGGIPVKTSGGGAGTSRGFGDQGGAKAGPSTTKAGPSNTKGVPPIPKKGSTSTADAPPPPKALTSDQILDKITGTGSDQRRTLGGFSFGADTRNNGGKNLISRPEVVTVKDGDKEVKVAVHLNVKVNSGSEVLSGNSSTVNLKVSDFHLTARSLADQNLIDQHGPSRETAARSVHVGPSNEEKGFDNRDGNIDNLAQSLGVSKDSLVQALDDRFGSPTATAHRFQQDVGRAVINGSAAENVNVGFEGSDKSFPIRNGD
ncbi:hypothetical protein [Streptomyces sp. NBC_01190]|uniref:hypothetical protein n=1 Tax=Streptomyces sp. NBC_01190 TaxID=2903767 RepID=UPI0038687EC1|nr:hypothetical protein OG519_31600 [Streptomyces sp. NBC_01190]